MNAMFERDRILALARLIGTPLTVMLTGAPVPTVLVTWAHVRAFCIGLNARLVTG